MVCQLLRKKKGKVEERCQADLNSEHIPADEGILEACTSNRPPTCD